MNLKEKHYVGVNCHKDSIACYIKEIKTDFKFTSTICYICQLVNSFVIFLYLVTFLKSNIQNMLCIVNYFVFFFILYEISNIIILDREENYVARVGIKKQ